MVFNLASCDKSGSIKKAYENAGYTVSIVDWEQVFAPSLAAGTITLEHLKNFEKYEFFKVSKDYIVVYIVKFPSSGELKKFFTDEKNTSRFDNAIENGNINGNCWLVPNSSNDPFNEAKDIFKNA